MKYRKSHSETYTNAVNAPTEYTTSEKLLTIRLYLSLFKCLRTVHTRGHLTMII